MYKKNLQENIHICMFEIYINHKNTQVDFHVVSPFSASHYTITVKGL